MRLQREPLEQSELLELCRRLGIPSDFDIAQFCWKPDYDPHFYQQLKKRSQNVYLFRDEYIFQLPRAIVAEVPQLGHATYIFAKAGDVREFVNRTPKPPETTFARTEATWRNNSVSSDGSCTAVIPRTWDRELRCRIGETVDYSLLSIP